MTVWKQLFSASIIWMSLFLGTSAVRRSYIAATYEHARFGKESDPPSLVLETNLAMYRRAAEIASSKGSDIIVYPEFGLYRPGNRTQLKDYLEETPDPKKIRANPCEEREAYWNRPMLHTLSCIAKNNSIVVVANTGSIKDCSGEEDCRDDGFFYYNTNVVFDRDGTLLLRYYKEHLFFEDDMDLPKEQQDPTFKTDFGIFATYICFDLIFGRMSEVAKWPQVDGVMFSTMWFYMAPQYVSVPFFQGWAMGNNATIIASNVQIPGFGAVGSGIFHGLHGSLGYTFNPDGISKLVVAKVPVPGDATLPSNTSVTAITKDNAWDWTDDGKNVPDVCSVALLNKTTNLMKDYRCLEENTANYTLVRLTQPSGYAEVCNNGMCCSLNYYARSMTENFYLGINNGTHDSFDRYHWCEESCFVTRCDDVEGRVCSTFPSWSNTVFHHLEMRSNFSTPYIYPSITGSKFRLVPLTEWEFNVDHASDFKGSINFHSKTGRKLLTAGFKARCYQRDPPYVK